MKLNLPDPMKEEHQDYEPLDRVGMESVEALLNLNGLNIPCAVHVFVSLDKKASRGIHMSRLYLLVQSALQKNITTFDDLKVLLEEILETHKDLSHSAQIEIEFKYPLIRHALKSSEVGIRNYKSKIKMHLNSQTKKVRSFLHFEVLYSSTCPASASLARQLQKEHFENHFGQETLSKKEIADWLGHSSSVIATPHAQRSRATLQLEVGVLSNISILKTLIDAVEDVLKTPVQGPVKREDEQAFAKLNGKNLMFCEDVARRLKKYLDEQKLVFAYKVKVSHMESLHPHNAVAFVEGKKKT
ncbi:MAG TPA: GTP cyclohydrolase FolE2 [Pseudobdellovibrionaceae bacterium]|nr:GTP cyclohydrolase FolE2 [Pseudobdellovibrionaceae bacterium]